MTIRPRLNIALAVLLLGSASTPPKMTASPLDPAPVPRCDFSIRVENRAASASMKVTKISTAAIDTTPQIYKKQWDGSVTIAAGKTHTFNFTVDQCLGSAHLIKIYYTRNGNDQNSKCQARSGGYCGVQ
jgi:hypothetical protein